MCFSVAVIYFSCFCYIINVLRLWLVCLHWFLFLHFQILSFNVLFICKSTFSSFDVFILLLLSCELDFKHNDLECCLFCSSINLCILPPSWIELDGSQLSSYEVCVPLDLFSCKTRLMVLSYYRRLSFLIFSLSRIDWFVLFFV